MALISPIVPIETKSSWSTFTIKARNILVEHNLRLVAHIIKKYYAVNVDQDDLVKFSITTYVKNKSKNILT